MFLGPRDRLESCEGASEQREVVGREAHSRHNCPAVTTHGRRVTSAFSGNWTRGGRTEEEVQEQNQWAEAMSERSSGKLCLI